MKTKYNSFLTVPYDFLKYARILDIKNSFILNETEI